MNRLHLSFCSSGGLVCLNQIANTNCICFSVAMAGDRIASARGINDDVRPHHAGCNLYGSYLRNGDTLFGAAEQAGFYPAHTQAVDYNFCWEDEVAFGPATG